MIGKTQVRPPLKTTGGVGLVSFGDHDFYLNYETPMENDRGGCHLATMIFFNCETPMENDRGRVSFGYHDFI